MRALCLALLCCAFVRVARAQSSSGPDTPAYHEAISEALSEFEAQNYPEARRHFARAHELFPNARTFRGLGIVSFELRRYSESIVFCEQALASQVRPLESSMRLETERLLERAHQLVGQLDVDIDPRAAVVVIDDTPPRPVDGTPITLDVGPHHLEFQGAGYQSQRRAWTVEGGERAHWKVDLRPDQTEQVSTRAAAASHPKRRALQIALASSATLVGVASFALAAVYASKHGNDGDRLRVADPRAGLYSSRLQTWQDGRGRPYAFAALGSVALSSGLMGWAWLRSSDAFPWWASALTGAAGAGLAAWGVVEVVGGGSCSGALASRGDCSAHQERRDRGALIVLAGAPLLSVPLARSLRGSSANARAVSLIPQVDLRRSSASLTAQLAW